MFFVPAWSLLPLKVLPVLQTPGSLISFLTYNKQFAQPINQITMQMNSIVMAIAGGERIFKLLDEKPEVDDRICYTCKS